MGYRILFLISPMLGHIQTTLEVVEELLKEGHEVTYYATPQYKELIKGTGATVSLLDHPSFPPTKKQLSEVGKYFQTDETRVLSWLILRTIRCSFGAIQVMKQLESQKFDMVIYDPMVYNYQIAKKVDARCYGTWISTQVINMEGMPGVKFKSIFSVLELVQVVIWMYITLIYLVVVHQFQFKSVLATPSIKENFNMVCIPKEFQQPLKYQKIDLVNDNRFYFDGPFIREEDSKELVGEFPFHKLTRPKTMYISLGSISTNQEKIYHTFMEAYTHPYFEGWNIILNCDDTEKLKKRGQIPSNFIVQAFVPQIAILKRSDFYVCHGGVNSTMEAVMYNVPQLILPQMPERLINAKSVQRLEIGDYVSQYVTAKELREKSIRLIEDKETTKGIEKFKHILQQQSARKAAKHIVEYILKSNN